MRLSTVGRYALRAMVDLAQNQDAAPVRRQDIADRQEISSDYLAQLFTKLRHAGLVESVKGPGGGYLLARAASAISAGDVLRAVEETLSPVWCVENGTKGTCPRATHCTTHPLWSRLDQRITEVLDTTTLDELCPVSVHEPRAPHAVQVADHHTEETV